MGNVDLLPQEKETVLQNLPQVGFCCLFSSFLGSILCHVFGCSLFAAFLLQGVGWLVILAFVTQSTLLKAVLEKHLKTLGRLSIVSKIVYLM